MTIDPKHVFDAVEAERITGRLPKNVTTSRYIYQGTDRPGILEQVNNETGERKLGATASLRLFLMTSSGQKADCQRSWQRRKKPMNI